jgi:hypothetical protein
MTKSEAKPMDHWNVLVRLDSVPDDGLHVTLTADPATCATVARLVDVDAVLRFEARFDVIRHGKSGLTVTGEVSARVRQSCVLTLEPVENDISEPVVVVFAAPKADAKVIPEEIEIAVDGDDSPEPLVNGTADLGHLATEFLALAVDRYPRKPGVEFRPPATADHGGSPFDALAVLKKNGNQPS